MPIMYGIAALAVLANGVDQQGVDPQIDKQYAIVKQNGAPEPVVQQTSVEGQRGNVSFSVSQGGNSDIAVIQGREVAVQQKANVETQVSVTAREHGISIASSPATTISNSGQSRIVTLGSPSRLVFGTDRLSQLKGMDRKVSVQFNNASASDVLKWLSKQNVNFVANVDKLPKTKVTMSVHDVPLSEVLESVAESLGGSWQVKGSTLIFQSGMFHSLQFAPARLGDINGLQFKSFGNMNRAFEKSMQGLDGQMKALNFDLKAMPRMDMKSLEQMKTLRNYSGDAKAFNFKMDPKAMAELKKLGGEQLLTKNAKTFTFGKNLKVLGDLDKFKKIDVEKFLKSLSETQKVNMKKNGFLTFDELSDAQKAMIFDGSVKDMPKDFTMSFSNDKGSVTIKKQ